MPANKNLITDVLFIRFTLFRENNKTTHKPTIIQYRHHGVSQTNLMLSIHHRQHRVKAASYLNGLFTDCSSQCSKEKMHINVVVIGHVDSGKSTTTGKLTWSLVANFEHLLTHTYRALDLQVRWNRQAYHREVREGKIATSLHSFVFSFRLIAKIAPRWGSFASNKFAPDNFGTTTSIHIVAMYMANTTNRKPLSWARVPSSMRGFLTS